MQGHAWSSPEGFALRSSLLRTPHSLPGFQLLLSLETACVRAPWGAEKRSYSKTNPGSLSTALAATFPPPRHETLDSAEPSPRWYLGAGAQAAESQHCPSKAAPLDPTLTHFGSPPAVRPEAGGQLLCKPTLATRAALSYQRGGRCIIRQHKPGSGIPGCEIPAGRLLWALIPSSPPSDAREGARTASITRDMSQLGPRLLRVLLLIGNCG